MDSGIDSNKVGVEATPAGASPAEAGSEAPACGPGCACGKPAGSGKLKIAVSLTVLLAIAGIFVYKAVAKSDTANNTTAKNNAAFALA